MAKSRGQARKFLGLEDAASPSALPTFRYPLVLPPIHGGDITSARARYGGAPGDWLDLSTGINPNPYPFTWPEQGLAAALPQAGDLEHLLAAATKYYGMGSSGCIVAASGTQALIQLLPRLIARSSVAIIGPTYEEHAASWTRCGHDVQQVTTLEDAERSAIAVLVNPDNPTGRVYRQDDLRPLRTAVARRGGMLIVDEAFVDVAPELSLAFDVRLDGLVILRSFGKFFGLAGLRLGFALCPPALALRVQQELGLWAVAGPTLSIATQALSDHAWIASARARLAADAQRLDQLLHAAGFHVLGGTTLFRLVATDIASELADCLAQRRILVRHFPTQPRWLRFGLPANETGFRRLETALAG